MIFSLSAMIGYTFTASSLITHFPGVLVQHPKQPTQWKFLMRINQYTFHFSVFKLTVKGVSDNNSFIEFLLC